MLILVGVILGGMGLISILTRRTLLGLMIGIQLLILGATTSFVLVGIGSGARVEGHLFAFFLALGAVGQLIAGWSVIVRRFYLKNRINVDELRSLQK